MQMTRQADYAVRAMVYLAQHGREDLVATAKIAQEQKIPGTFLAKIIAQLGTAGLVQAMRGTRGGIRLARAPANISLLQVVEAVDGSMLINECVSNPASCPLGPQCTVQPVWCQVQAELVDRLEKITFADLLPPSSNLTANNN
jgi:Rrf2 family protein